MKKTLSFLLILGFALACSSGKRALERGDYDKAVYQAIDRLQSKPDHDKSRDVLRTAYPLGLKYHQSRIQQLKALNDPFVNEDLAGEYAQLNALGNALMRCPACLQLVQPKLFPQEEEAYSEKAANYRMRLAADLMQSGERQNAIAAYRHLEVAERYQPNNSVINREMQEARQLAMLHVVVAPLFPANSFQFNYLDVLNDRLVDFLHRRNNNLFVSYYTPQEAEARGIDQPDQEVQLGVSFFVPQRETATNTYETFRDSVLIKTQRNPQGRYTRVSATITETIVELNGHGQLALIIKDSRTRAVLRQEIFSQDYFWSDRFASFRGDERALTEAQWQLVNHKPLPIPSIDFIFQATTDPLYDRSTRFLRDYYARY